MADQKGKAGSGSRKAAEEVLPVRTGLPPMVRSDKQGGSKKIASAKSPAKTKAKDAMRDGAPKSKK